MDPYSKQIIINKLILTNNKHNITITINNVNNKNNINNNKINKINNFNDNNQILTTITQII